jgi:CheY-like chemotaxis protein
VPQPPAPVTGMPPAATAPAKAPKPPKVPKATLLPSLPRALLVDDSVIALLFLEKRLERWQVQTDTASNSQAALALLAQHSHDLVFLDVELGPDSELDGLSLCRQIKQTPASMSTLVVMVSAHHSEMDRVRGALAGCDAYLAKPLDEAELQRVLQRQGLRPKSEAGSVPG